MVYKLPQINLQELARQKKEGVLKWSKTPTPNILSGSPVARPDQKPQTLLTLKQPLLTGTAQKLEEIKTRLPQKVTPAPVPTQTGYVPLTKEQFQKARAAGFTPEKIIEMEKKRKEQSVPVEPKKSFSEKVDKFWADLTAKGMSWAIRWTGNILWTATKWVGWVWEKIGQWLDLVTPWDQSGFGKWVREMGTNIWNRLKAGAEETAKDFEAMQAKYSSQWSINQESAAAKIGWFIWETIPAMYSGWAAAKWIIGTSAKLLPKIARWGIEWYAIDVASGSETPWVGTIAGAVLPWVWAGVAKLWWELWLKWLLKFGAKKKVAKQIADEVGESASKIDIYKWMKDRGITKKFADEDAMANRLYEHSKQAKNAVDDITKTLSEKWATIKADQNVLGWLAKVIEKKGGSQSAEEIVKLNRANALLAKANKTGNLTLQEANEAKRLIDDSLDLYTFQWDVRMKNVDNANLRAGIRKSIEDIAKKFWVNIRDYNKEISIARTLADGITDKQMSNELVDRLWDFGMKTASRWVIGNIIAPFWHETKTDYLLNGIAGFVIWGTVNKAVWNRRLVNFASNVMTSFSGAEKNIIKEYFKNKKMTPQAEKVIVKLADKMDEAYKQLPPWEQRLLLSPPKWELQAPKGNALPMPKVPEWANYPKTDIIAESNRGINFWNVKTTVPETSILPKVQSKNSILEQATKPQAEVSKVVKKSASKDIKNPDIISQITKKQTVPAKPVGTVKTLDKLTKEARKYDTLEDFVKAVKNDILDDWPLSKVINDYKKAGGKDVVLKDFYLDANKPPTKSPLPLSQKTDVVETIAKEAKNNPIISDIAKTGKAEGTVVHKADIEILPSDVKVYDESRLTWAKRIAPDRVPHQQMTPEEWIQWIINDKMKTAKKNHDAFSSIISDIDTLKQRYGDKMPTRIQAEKWNFPNLKEDRNKWDYIERNSSWAKTFDEAKATVTRRAEYWKGNMEKPDYYKESSTNEYIDLVKKDISKGYRYPDAVLDYKPEFRKAITARERYEKWLNTSFWVDDPRIVFDEVDKIWAGMKRQDGKAILPEQKQEIIKWVIDFSDALWLDMKKVAKDDRWVYAHLNGKNPFLMKDVSGLYRPWKDGISISVWWAETFDKLDKFWRPVKDAEWKIIKEKVHTTMAHELWHAIDYKVNKKLIEPKTIEDLRFLMNKDTDAFRENPKYYRKSEEIVARMIEQFVAEAKWQNIRSQTAQWSKEIFDSKVKPAVEKAIKEYYSDFLK